MRTPLQMRDWKHYLQANSPKGQDCQLVSAVNAYYHLTGRRIEQGSKRYAALRRLCRAEHGSAICIEKVWGRLGLERRHERYFLFWTGARPTRSLMPTEASVSHKAYGLHSVLIVDRAPKCAALRVTNFHRATSLQGWIFEEDFHHFLTRVAPPSSVRCWSFRLKRKGP